LQNQEGFKEKNLFQLIPVLTINGQHLTESLAIVEYLEEKYPGRCLLSSPIRLLYRDRHNSDKRKLLPGNAEDRAKIRALALQVRTFMTPSDQISFH